MARRFLAVVLALLFLALAPVALLALGVQTLFLDPRYFKTQLVKLDLYAQVYSEVVPALARSIEVPQGLPLSQQDIETLVRRVVPESFVRTTTDQVIDEMFAVMTAQKDRLEINISVARIKQQAPDEVARVLDEKLAQLPPCLETTASLSDQLLGLLGSSGGAIRFPTCLPSGSLGDRLRSEFREQLITELRRIANDFPDNVDLAAQIKGVDEWRSSLEVPRRAMGIFVPTAQAFYALLIVLLIVIGVLGGNSFNSGLGWIGGMLVIGGVGVLLAAQWATTTSGAVAGYAHATGAPRELVASLSLLITSSYLDLLRRVQIEAGGVVALGALLFYVSRKI